MKKKIMITMLCLLGVGLVVATGLVISTLTLTVGVAEPFTVEYAVLGDGGDYNVSEDGTCASNIGNSVWFDETTELPYGPMFPEESRKFCVKVDNAGESPITYSVTSKVANTGVKYEACANAFPETTIYGVVPGETTITNGEAFTVPGNASVVTGCEIEISVARGVTEGEATIQFTQKDTATWKPIVGGKTAEITYTVIGNEFEVSKTGGILNDYTLIYYPDTGDFATNVAGILVYGDDEFPTLPIAEDVGDGYCTNTFNLNAEVCDGAKLWLIPGNDLTNAEAKVLVTDWNTNAKDFLFETDLITYTKTA